MENSYKDIYIGQLIQQRLDETHMSYAEFARRIHVARSSLYRIFASKSIDVERLLLISSVLDYDFLHNVYLAHAPSRLLPRLELPIRDGHIVLDELPTALVRLLRDALPPQ